ncbi:PQQ-dependent sugar dehydrogenase [Phototrophicus methaneseepsis]|nr:PQQ-dependent sugar dehydrogenase [Phototrophicus methaneseepsis]
MMKRLIALLLMVLMAVPTIAQDATPTPSPDASSETATEASEDMSSDMSEDMASDAVIAVEAAPTSADVTLQQLSLTNADGSAFTPVRPLYLTHAADGTDRLYLVQQGGRILVMQNGEFVVSDFLDVSDLVSPEANGSGYSERGLLGLAFHPGYAENGFFYINYTDAQGTTKVAQYSVSADDPNVADPASAQIILEQPQPFANHNGGHMAFGPDGYLYISLGDGGDQGDPMDNGQNPTTLLGTILRVAVGEGGYKIPDENPFAGSDAGADEVWAYGFRNVWRFSFDRATGDLYIGDVGQNQWEEINFQPADSPGGENYGWNIYEGTHAYEGGELQDSVVPIAEYDHSQGCSVTGGYIYRGEAIPALQGVYLYSDYCTGTVWMAYRDANLDWQSGAVLMQNGFQVSSFGEDESGELYVVGYSGALYKLVPPA